MSTCQDALATYLLERDLASETEEYYRRVVSVFLNWLATHTTPPPFASRTVSQFLKDKQTEGTSSYYRRSLRSGLVALLRHSGDESRVRSVRLDELDPQSWSTDDVCSLLEVARNHPHRDETFFPTLIEAAYYSGFSQGDLFRLTKASVTQDGIAVIRRSRTRKREIGWIPPAAMAPRPDTGPMWGLPYSAEMFRRHFAKIVAKAGLTGTFKRLRKSSGTGVEERYPGRGHEHLGNSRLVFERHYWSRSGTPEPLRPPPLGAAL